jgi:hypothetical protein
MASATSNATSARENQAGVDHRLRAIVTMALDRAKGLFTVPDPHRCESNVVSEPAISKTTQPSQKSSPADPQKTQQKRVVNTPRICFSPQPQSPQ